MLGDSENLLRTLVMRADKAFEGDQEHLDLLRRATINGDTSHWNEWRKANPGLSPDLRRIDMPGANLVGADLSRANFSNP